MTSGDSARIEAARFGTGAGAYRTTDIAAAYPDRVAAMSGSRGR
jgi:hypothetical protein